MSKVISLKSLANMLRELDEEALEELFDLLLVEWDDSPLTEEEKAAVKEAKDQYARGEVVIKSADELG